MKVLQINAVNAIGSTGRNCAELSEYLIKQGHDCVTAYATGPNRDPAKNFVIGSLLDRKLHALFSRMVGKQAYFSKRATKKLLAYMEAYAPDIVVLNNLHGNYVNLPMLLSFLAKNDIPTVAVLHDCWFFTGKCCHYTVLGCNKWQNGCGGCKSLKKYNKSWFFDFTATMVADKERLFSAIPRLGVVGVSDWLTNEAKKAPVFQKAREITRIYNWIDLSIFTPSDGTAMREKLGVVGKKVILCVASIWEPAKGVQTIRDLSKMLSEDEVIVVVGNGADGVNFDENVIRLKATDSVEELVSLYSMADVLLQPSLEETFGKVVAESLACGTPAVCFASTANPELIGEGCGMVVKVGETCEMLRQIRTIFSNSKAAYTEKCRAFAQEKFDMKDNLAEYMGLFERLTSKETIDPGDI